jgi:integrase
MRGHIRQRGKVWSYVIELGNQKTQRCTDCNRRHWVERRPFESCEKCGGELRYRIERRQREETGFRTKKEAEAALTTELGKMQTGTYIAPSKITVREYLSDEWLPAVKATVKPTTYLSYEIHVGRHINPVLGNIPLQKLSGAAINAFYARLLTEPRKPVLQPRRPEKEPSPAKERLHRARLSQPQPEPEKEPEPLSRLSIRKIHATLHKAFADAVRWNRITRNPADAADPPKTRSGVTREMKTWTAKELQAFLTARRECRLYPLWLVLASTGMRRGEALGLRWEDVDTDNARLSIRQNMVTVGYVVHIGKPKTGRGRNVSVDPATLAALKAYRKQQLEEKILWRKAGYVDSGFVFRRENGLPYHPDFVSQMFEKAVRTSEQPRIRLHDLRHTHATLALQAGIHPKVVSERLGHANISITLDVYSHAIPAMEEEAAAKIAALFMPA